MATNSKSGELFLFSSDRRFIIKTLSSKECFCSNAAWDAAQKGFWREKGDERCRGPTKLKLLPRRNWDASIFFPRISWPFF
jgi:hypothetical protein